jgi:septal ring factor EnvC (AmiA/AmiB activator)
VKRIILTVAVCCAFSAHGIATNSAAELKRIETLKKEINALKVERENIYNKLPPIRDEMKAITEKMDAINAEIKNPSCNRGVCTIPNFKARIEKIENNIKVLMLFVAEDKFRLDIDKINLSIDKANIELIKVEIKAGKTPKIPLEIAKVLVRRNSALFRVNEATIKIKQAEIKEAKANIKYFENIVETGTKTDEIRRNTNDSYDYICATNIEIAELKVKRAALILKLEQARREIAQARIKEAQAGAEFSKIQHKLCKTFVKLNKVIDKKNFISFFNHD